MNSWMIYGATGYTGRLVAEEAVRQGLKPILAGRSEGPLRMLAASLGLAYRLFALDDPQAVRDGTAGCSLVLHCAGPFKFTSAPMANACLENGAHYLDITGEIDVFEALAARDVAAKAAGVMLMPGAGFDVVPTDCLAAYLKTQLPEASHLELVIYGMGTQMTHGTMLSAVEGLHRPNRIRRDGQIMDAPYAAHRKTINLGRGPRKAIGIPWGDVATAFYTTGIPNIVVYSTAMARIEGFLRFIRPIQPLFAYPPIKQIIQAVVRSRPSGPTPEQRQNGRSIVWGEVRSPSGQVVQAQLVTPEAYQLTALTSVVIAGRVLQGAAVPGFQTPAGVFGADFILEFQGVERTHLTGRMDEGSPVKPGVK